MALSFVQNTVPAFCTLSPPLLCFFRAEPGEPPFGSLVWAMWRALRLTFRKVLNSADNKKLFLQTMVQLITTATARPTDPALLRECLDIVRLWLLEPENNGMQTYDFKFLQTLCACGCWTLGIAVGTLASELY